MNKKAPYWLSTLSALTTSIFILMIAHAVTNKVIAFALVVLAWLMFNIFIDGAVLCFTKGFNKRPE